MAYLLRFMLEREGFTVFTAADGRAAVALLDAQPPADVALFDVMLPYTSGYELIRLLRGHPTWGGVPIIMLTGQSAERDIVRALDAGANDYVLKPFQPSELFARVRRYCRRAPPPADRPVGG
jgi:DNA-binding response OmpR family regulator